MKNSKSNFNIVCIKLFLFLCILLGLSNKTQAQTTSNGTLDFELLAFGSNPCVIWIENADGDYLETVYLSEFVGLEGAGWPKPSGKGWQCVMPIWAHRRNIIQDGSIYPPPSPTPPLDGIDAVSGATPTQYNSPTYSLSLDNYPYGTYRCWIEINGNNDENDYYYWPLNPWGNGQPSVVYFVDINVSESPDEATTDSYYGYSDFSGNNGDINPPDNTITTALNLLQTQNGYKFKANFTPDNNIPEVVIEDVVNGERCGSGTVELSATANIGTINWYASKTSTTVLATGTSYSPSISSTTTYYVDATYDGNTSDKVAVTATVNPIPNITGTADDSREDPGEVNLEATADQGDVLWYDAETEGNLLHNGTSYSTTISTTTVFYVEASNNVCTSPSRTAVTASINGQNQMPEIIEVNNNSRCGPGEIEVSVKANIGTIYWYAWSWGSTVLATGETYSSNITYTRTYYVEAIDENGNTSGRVPVTATVKTIPTFWRITGDSREEPGEVTLIAGAHGEVYWYDTVDGGKPLGTGMYFSTYISNTTVFYVEAINNGCISASPRTPVTGTILNPATQSAQDLVNDMSSNELIQEENYNISIYPNPSFDLITITSTTDQQIEELTILNQTGKIINQYQNLSSESSINISAYAPGLYYLKVTLNNNTLVKKFIKL